MPAYQLSPACKDSIWGGQRLKTDFNIQCDTPVLAEAWMLSCHPDGPSILLDGPYAGRTLPEYLASEGQAVLGENCRNFADFPMLIKFIDAKEDLSIQVHPSDEYALRHEGQYGKTEMWVALEAAPGSFLYYGFQNEISREEFSRRIADGTLAEVMRKVPVKAGDVIFIPSGTLHAIGAGVVVAEIQQNSNVTYRVYDYGRVGPDGNLRPLHIEQALEVTDLKPAAPVDFGSHLGNCRYFTVDGHEGGFTGECGTDSFHALLVIGGAGRLFCGGETKTIQKGACFFIPAGSGEYRVEGDCQTLTAYVPKQ